MDLGRVAQEGRHSAKGNSGEELQCDAWEVSASRRWPPGPPSVAAAPLCAGGAEAERERGGR